MVLIDGLLPLQYVDILVVDNAAEPDLHLQQKRRMIFGSIL